MRGSIDIRHTFRQYSSFHQSRAFCIYSLVQHTLSIMRYVTFRQNWAVRIYSLGQHSISIIHYVTFHQNPAACIRLTALVSTPS